MRAWTEDTYNHSQKLKSGSCYETFKNEPEPEYTIEGFHLPIHAHAATVKLTNKIVRIASVAGVFEGGQLQIWIRFGVSNVSGMASREEKCRTRKTLVAPLVYMPHLALVKLIRPLAESTTFPPTIRTDTPDPQKCMGNAKFRKPGASRIQQQSNHPTTHNAGKSCIHQE
jgi:hypothetical protein